MFISRRSFFRLAAGAGSILAAPRAFNRLGMMSALAQGPDYKALVCIFLFGGNDGGNMIVPLESQPYSRYSAVRGPSSLGLAANTLRAVGATSGAYGFHPSLAPFQTLYQQKRLAVVANVGTLVAPVTKSQYRQNLVPVPSGLFSHSDQQAQFQSAVLQGPSSSGWGGRVADEIQAMNASPGHSPGRVAGGQQSVHTRRHHAAGLHQRSLGAGAQRLRWRHSRCLLSADPEV